MTFAVLARSLLIMLLAFSTFKAAGAVPAEAGPIVRAEIEPQSVLVGKPAELKITVLVPTWFTRPPVYPNIELANAITRLPKDSSYPIRERFGNESWSGIIRSYEVFPLLAANYKLDGLTISIAYANPGADPIIVEADIPVVTIRGSVPDGAATLDPYIAGSRLTLNLEVDGTLNDLEVGDALVLNYSAELEGLPAIFLPPLAPQFSFEGVSVYKDSPILRDDATSRRSEKLTLVLNAGGEFVVPDLALSFWNTEEETIESASAKGFTFNVIGPEPSSVRYESNPDGLPWILIGSAGLLAITVYLLGPALVRYLAQAKESRRRSEPYAFALVKAALQSNDAGESYRTILAWLKKLDPELSLRQLAHHHGDTELISNVELLSQSRYSPEGEQDALNTNRLHAGLTEARQHYLADLERSIASHLPPLNP